MCSLLRCSSCSRASCCVPPDHALVLLCHGNGLAFGVSCIPEATEIETVPLLGFGIEVFSLFDTHVKNYRKRRQL